MTDFERDRLRLALSIISGRQGIDVYDRLSNNTVWLNTKKMELLGFVDESGSGKIYTGEAVIERAEELVFEALAGVTRHD